MLGVRLKHSYGELKKREGLLRRGWDLQPCRCVSFHTLLHV